MKQSDRLARNERILAELAEGRKPSEVARQFGLSRAGLRYIRSPKLRLQSKTHSQVQAAVAGGRLVKPRACERCGRVRKLHGHHPDYAQPLRVQWLCVFCHDLTHRYLNAGKPLPPHGFVRASREHCLEAEVEHLRHLLAVARTALRRAARTGDASTLNDALRQSAPNPKRAAYVEYVPIERLTIAPFPGEG